MLCIKKRTRDHFLRNQKKNSPADQKSIFKAKNKSKNKTLHFLKPLQKFGNETEHCSGICSVLEGGTSHTEGFLQDIGPGNHAFACFVNML